MRFARVVFGVSSSPFLLNATIRHHLKWYSDTHPELVQTMIRSTYMYVDDISFGAKDDDSAFELFKKSKKLLAEGGFNLRKFITNSESLQERINQSELHSNSREGGHNARVKEEDTTYAKDTLRTLLPHGEHKVLGVSWRPIEDQLVFDLSNVASHVRELEPTKRNIVGIATRFYDPLGFVSPITIQFKMLFQDLCLNRVDWDEPLSGDLLQRWKSNTRSKGQKEHLPRS